MPKAKNGAPAPGAEDGALAPGTNNGAPAPGATEGVPGPEADDGAARPGPGAPMPRRLVPRALPGPYAIVTALFFAWGLVTSVIDGLAPAARSIFRLSYAEQTLTQFAFFLAYGIMSVPSSILIGRVGAAVGIVIALVVMVAGCLLVFVGTHVADYGVILAALFVLASGVTLLQVASNPLSAALGPPSRSHSRLTLSQAFNALGTVLGPLVASFVLLRGGVFGGSAGDLASARRMSLDDIDHQFGLIACLIAPLALFVWIVRRRLRVPATGPRSGLGSPLAAFRSGWARFGAVAIFLYVGAEVSIGTFMINFLMQPSVLGVSAAHAGALLSIFWGGAMVGRFAGSQLLRRVRADEALGLAALVNIGLCLAVTELHGAAAAVAALSIGVFDSIMFPTIFTVTLDRSNATAPAVSGLLCTAIVGGAVLPPLCGMVADRADLGVAFFVPMSAYFGVMLFAFLGRARLDMRLVKS